ncbi:ankyrin repeat and SOCS box protein 3-like [Zerene cesonia]|uniref:ankyrin repeat and SOCS box protein 3-like n=1 Tax=Zerene cesonia TaxID=33412 RepID=UPI0018E52959|nr:ankyrin repeat and SOCS box protein 3-like [Zerene cesonia]
MDFSSCNPASTNSLNIAARKNDVQTVQRLLRKINPNCVDNRGWTCLHEAAANDSYESLELILNHPDTRPLAETHEGHTALYLACRHRSSIKVIKALLDHLPDMVNYGSTENVTPLHICSAQGRIEIVQLLIEYNAMLDVQDFDGDTPLHDAALATEHEAVEVLLHAGAEPEIRNDANYTPFHLACYKGCLETIKNLLLFVTDINQVTVHGDTPLIFATQGFNDEVVKFLLENGADPNIKNVDGELALTQALSLGYTSIFKILLEVTDVNVIDYNIILRACKPHYFKLEILESLLKHDLSPEFFNISDPFLVTLEKIGDWRPTYAVNAPLNSYLNVCEYIYNNSPEKFEEFFHLFLWRGVLVDALNIYECPPLVYIHYCMHSACFQDVFRLFRQFGCNVDYCSAPNCIDKEKCVPDVFIASLTSDPTTLPIMLPHSLYCEPQFILTFANDNGVLGRIPQSVQNQLLAMIGILSEGATSESLSFIVFPLKHLCRVKIRSHLRKSKTALSTEKFFYIIHKIELPPLLKNYLCYA